VTPLIRCIIIGICVAIATFGAFGVFKFTNSVVGIQSSLEPELRPSLFVKLWANDRHSGHLEKSGNLLFDDESTETLSSTSWLLFNELYAPDL
jgi:hypothetical protein